MTNWKYSLYRSGWRALDLLFPPVCGGCGRTGSRWCRECLSRTNLLNGILCDVCGIPQDKAGTCKACLASKPHFRSLRAWAAFDDPLRSALHKLKYRRDFSMGDAIAAEMIPFVKKLDWGVDLVVPIPLGRQRMRERGYNQVAMVAKPLALGLGLKYSPKILTRGKETRTQVGLSREERRRNVHGAFIADRQVGGKAVLLIDDVSTTGSTLSACAETLYSSGARDVFALTVARALPHHGLAIA